MCSINENSLPYILKYTVLSISLIFLGARDITAITKYSLSSKNIWFRERLADLWVFSLLYYSYYGNMLPQRGMEVDRRAPNPSQGRLHVGQDG